jgi:hypothetical protein
MKIFVGLVILVVIGTEAAKEKAIKVKDKDMMRKMVIYDKVSFIHKSLMKFHNLIMNFLYILRKLQTCFIVLFQINN